MSDSPTQSHDDKSEKTEKAVLSQIQEINSQVAQFRDLLINIGQSRDGPELREQIRKLRRRCVEACKAASQQILPQARTTVEFGIPVDCPNLVLLFYVIQLLLRELCKSKNLIRIVPMDMSTYYNEYYKSRPGPSNIGNVISQILLCKQITPDFNEEELYSIRKDSEEIRDIIRELQEFMPQADIDAEKYSALQERGVRGNRGNGYRRARRRNNNPQQPREPSYIRGAFRFFCCAARANYV